MSYVPSIPAERKDKCNSDMLVLLNAADDKCAFFELVANYFFHTMFKLACLGLLDAKES